jgi:hypothetical protein
MDSEPPTWRTRPPHLWPLETGWPSYTTRYDMHGLQWDYSLIPATTREILVTLLLKLLNQKLKLDSSGLLSWVRKCFCFGSICVFLLLFFAPFPPIFLVLDPAHEKQTSAYILLILMDFKVVYVTVWQFKLVKWHSSSSNRQVCHTDVGQCVYEYFQLPYPII